MKMHLWQATRLKRMSKEAFDNLPSGVCFSKAIPHNGKHAKM